MELTLTWANYTFAQSLVYLGNKRLYCVIHNERAGYLLGENIQPALNSYTDAYTSFPRGDKKQDKARNECYRQYRHQLVKQRLEANA